ncbi:hypothetical protein [Suttonella ornithocola]|uniref:Uncharacterized low-complexity protein n=1 Tax=Suttonella ornithocola TaxID=279832 RepID=A0A380MP62_9GAMM|nr:hypothetical protein [Suttonella ornithocola]SUO94409.1 Uncharacterized low-complexity protein [Suttonella ornithocola]
MKKTFSSIALGSTLALATSVAQADVNPFSATKLNGGYETKTNEGACGGKSSEAKCGGTTKPSEAKCGEGKCGGESQADCTDTNADCQTKSTEAKCGEGKCGG